MPFEPLAVGTVAHFDSAEQLGRVNLPTANDAPKVATSFTALFLEQMLNESMSKDDPLTGLEKSAGIQLSEQLMNRQLAEVMAQSSPVRLTIEKQLTYAADAQ